MQKQYTVSNDKSIYEAFPDIAEAASGELICVFLECEHHALRKNVRIAMTKSCDGGRSWSAKTAFTDVCRGKLAYNCPRISLMPDGSLAVICDMMNESDHYTPGGSEQNLWRSYDGGNKWEGPEILPFTGIVPDKYRVLSNGRHIIGLHSQNASTGRLEQHAYYSDNSGKSWTKTVVASDERYNLCEGSILEIKEGVLAAFMRENSNKGFPCMKALSYDFGTTWEGVFETNIDCCHRPVADFCEDNRIFMTYRYMQGGKGWVGHWTQNLFGAFFDAETALAKHRDEQSVRIFPISYDRSPESDTGYSGWVRRKNGEFYVVNYLLDDAPKAQIRGYSFEMSDVIL